MGKPKRERSLAANEALAVATMLRTSPRKLGLVAGMIQRHGCRQGGDGARVLDASGSRRR